MWSSQAQKAHLLVGAGAVDGSGAESPSFSDDKFRYWRQFPELEDVTFSQFAPSGAIILASSVSQRAKITAIAI